MTCEHTSKVCLDEKWKWVHRPDSMATIELWHCNDCSQDISFDWHTKEWSVENPPDLGVNVSDAVQATERLS